MDEWTSKKVSLNEILKEEHPEKEPHFLDDDLVMSKFVTEKDIRAHYQNELENGKVVSNQAGGAREITIDERSLVENRPKVVIDNTLDLTPEDYRKAAFATGIPFRPNGLFPPNDTLLTKLSTDPTYFPFMKHVPCERPHDFVVAPGCWASGDSVAKAGLDVRHFYRFPRNGCDHGELHGAVRAGEGAAICLHGYTTAHGGSIETILDECTAEIAKCEFAPTATTINFKVNLKKPFPLHRTCRILCKIKSISSNKLRIVTTGEIYDAEDDTLLVTCEAELVDIARISANTQEMQNKMKSNGAVNRWNGM
jgi:hypothetical protein